MHKSLHGCFRAFKHVVLRTISLNTVFALFFAVHNFEHMHIHMFVCAGMYIHICIVNIHRKVKYTLLKYYGDLVDVINLYGLQFLR